MQYSKSTPVTLVGMSIRLIHSPPDLSLSLSKLPEGFTKLGLTATLSERTIRVLETISKWHESNFFPLRVCRPRQTKQVQRHSLSLVPPRPQALPERKTGDAGLPDVLYIHVWRISALIRREMLCVAGSVSVS